MTDLEPRNPNAGVIGCAVSIGGRRVAGGLPSDHPADPTALSGLAIEWGRSTTVDQPQPATCAVSLLDLPGDQTFLEVARVGAPIRIDASTITWSDDPDAWQNVHTDPWFDSYPLGGPVPVDVRAGTAVSGAAFDGQDLPHAAIITPGASAPAVEVWVPPAPFVAEGTAPDAWDTIPTVSVGHRWAVTAAVQAPPGSTIWIDPVLYAGPWDTAGELVPAAGDLTPDVPQTRPGTGHLVGVGVYVLPEHSGRWLGLRVRIAPAGYTWDTTPETWTWDTVEPEGWTWDAAGDIRLTNVGLSGPTAGIVRTVAVYAGRITDVIARYDRDIGGVVCEVTAQDFTADLANRYVGDDPWPAEDAAERMQRVLNLAGTSVLLLADPRPAGMQVSRVDVDRQPAADLLGQTASSVDAVIRAAVHPTTGPYLRIEDPADRPPLLVLDLVDGIVQIVPASTLPAGTVTLPADDVDLDPVRWQQTTADVMTRATVEWMDQTTQPDPTQRTVTITDTDAVAALGERTVSLSSLLTSAAAAEQIGAQLLARLDATGWRMSGVTVDTATLDLDPDRVDRVLTLLDGTARIGLPIRITGIPEWTPAPGAAAAAYVEGGRYAYVDGCWSLDLDVSGPNGLGRSIEWDQAADTWTWDDVDPSITWDDLTGVGAPET